jgi:hypothetical protein
MRPGTHVEPEFVEIAELGVLVGIVHPIPNDPDPDRTRLNQMQKVYRLTNRPGFPVIRIGSRLYFDRAAVVAYMRSGAHQSCRNQSQAVSPTILRSLSQD